MSVRVNLLPREIEERNTARRQRALIGVGIAALAVLLVFLYLMQARKVTAAQNELTAEQQRRDELAAQVDALSEFAVLEQRLAESNTLLVTTLSGEVSFAGILQDIAVVMPNDSALNSLAVTVNDVPTREAFDFGGPSFGKVAAAGTSLRGHAPGVERFLLEFEKVAAFFNLYFSGSSADESGVASFSAEWDLGPEIFTGRYANGLPEELR